MNKLVNIGDIADYYALWAENSQYLLGGGNVAEREGVTQAIPGLRPLNKLGGMLRMSKIAPGNLVEPPFDSRVRMPFFK